MKIDLIKLYTTVCGDEVKFQDIIIDDIKLIAFKIKRFTNSYGNSVSKDLTLVKVYV